MNNRITVRMEPLVEEEEEDEVCLVANLNSTTTTFSTGQRNIQNSLQFSGRWSWLLHKKFLLAFLSIFLSFIILGAILTVTFLPTTTFDDDTFSHDAELHSIDAQMFQSEMAPLSVHVNHNGDNSLESHEFLDEFAFVPTFMDVAGFEFLGQMGDSQSNDKKNQKIILYYMSNTSATQIEAQAVCEKSLQGNLIAPNRAEFAFIGELLTQHKISESWLLWTAGHRNGSTWWWLPNGPNVQLEALFYPKTVRDYTTFLLPMRNKNQMTSGGLTMFRRDGDFGYCQRQSTEHHHYVCQVNSKQN